MSKGKSWSDDVRTLLILPSLVLILLLTLPSLPLMGWLLTATGNFSTTSYLYIHWQIQLKIDIFFSTHLKWPDSYSLTTLLETRSKVRVLQRSGVTNGRKLSVIFRIESCLLKAQCSIQEGLQNTSLECCSKLSRWGGYWRQSDGILAIFVKGWRGAKQRKKERKKSIPKRGKTMSESEEVRSSQVEIIGKLKMVSREFRKKLLKNNPGWDARFRP